MEYLVTVDVAARANGHDVRVRREDLAQRGAGILPICVLVPVQPAGRRS